MLLAYPMRGFFAVIREQLFILPTALRFAQPLQGIYAHGVGLAAMRKYIKDILIAPLKCLKCDRYIYYF